MLYKLFEYAAWQHALEILSIIPALCSMLFNAHYTQNYAGIIGASLYLTIDCIITIVNFAITIMIVDHFDDYCELLYYRPAIVYVHQFLLLNLYST